MLLVLALPVLADSENVDLTQSDCIDAACEPSPTTQASEENPESESQPDNKENAKQGWIDRRHSFVSNKADELAVWMDGFFGVPRSDLEAAHSSLRIRLEYEWDEVDGSGTGAKIRGKLHLPRISERLSLIFADEDLDENSENEETERTRRDDNDDNSVAIQYNLLDQLRSRLDFNVGIRSGFSPQASVRYRTEIPIREKYLTRFTEEIFLRSGEGFGSVTRYDIDRAVSADRLVRMANRLKISEESDGLEWSTNLSIRKRLEKDQAIAYFTFVDGETRPNELTTAYGLGFLYRVNFFRRWLFAEIEPAYSWRREEPEDKRKGAAQVIFRIEIALEEDEAD